MNSLLIGTSASNFSAGQFGPPGTPGVTPFKAGANCTAVNMTAGAIVLNGSADGTTFAALVTVPTLGCADIAELPNYVKGASSGVYLLGNM